MTLSFAPLGSIECQLGEGATYDERTGLVWFVDIAGHALHRMDTAGGSLSTWHFESEVASLGLAASGRIVVALRDTVILFDTASGERRTLCSIEADRDDTRLNDGKVGPDGAFWIGTMNDLGTKDPIGALYRVAGSGTVERKVDRIAVSNGLAWTPDGETMFHSDSRGPWIDRWSFDRRSGAISGRTRIAEPGDDIGRPDGGAVDAAGTYWSAGVSAGRLNRFAPDGALLERHAAPASWPTMPCFGGADFHTLFVTTLKEGKSEEALAASPLSGRIFAAPSPVAGFAAWRFLDG